jgi:hypothetical protein
MLNVLSLKLEFSSIKFFKKCSSNSTIDLCINENNYLEYKNEIIKFLHDYYLIDNLSILD